MLGGMTGVVEIKQFQVARKKKPFSLDLSPVFLFLGVSGTDHGREARMQQRFEQEWYANIVTLRLSGQLPMGRYQLRGLPDEANKRGWTVTESGSIRSDLSDEGLSDFRQWWGRGARRVEAVPVS